MGNEVSRGTGTNSPSPTSSGVVPPRSPYTPTGGASRHGQSFRTRSPSPDNRSPQPRSSRRSLVGISSSSDPINNYRKERTIQYMDRAIRRRVRGGVTYNMKLLIRGAKGTGKTSLFQRLKGEPIPETHETSPQLQCATINWTFRQQLEENVNCDVWDVVDRGFVPGEAEEKKCETDSSKSVGADSAAAAATASAVVDLSEQESHKILGADKVLASATVAAAAAANGIQYFTDTVDASTVDVYHEAHGVIFMLDITKRDTLEYVKHELDNVPVHIPTLVLGNFRDRGNHRNVFKEDIRKLLFGLKDQPQQQRWRRPTELLYFECSLLDCYGLKSLHQYFGIPFLQLKLATISQQMRIVQDEFANLKHDVQATIIEQRYVEYVKHIKTTGSDIRTGRRGSGGGDTPIAASQSNSSVSSFREPSQTTPVAQRNGTEDDVSVVSLENSVRTYSEQTAVVASATAVPAEASLQEQKVDDDQDTKDSCVDSSIVATKAATSSRLEHKESVALLTGVAVEDDAAKPTDTVFTEQSSEALDSSNAHSSCGKTVLLERVIQLEDFQVPKTSISELNNFYSENESDEESSCNDEDIVIAPENESMAANVRGVYHKQPFLDSDSSDLDESESLKKPHKRSKEALRKSYRRGGTAKQANPVTNQTESGAHQSSRIPTSPLPPTTALQSRQRSKFASPARPSRDVALSTTLPAALPVSSSVSSDHHESENGLAGTVLGTRGYEQQGRSERSLPSEEPAGPDDTVGVSGQVPLLEHEKLKSVEGVSIDSADGASNITHISSSCFAIESKVKDVSVAPVQDAITKGTNCEPKNALHDQIKTVVKEEVNGRPADIEVSESSAGSLGEPDTTLGDGKELAKSDDIPIAGQRIVTDVPQLSSVAPDSPLCRLGVAGDDFDDQTSDEGGSIKRRQSPLKESPLILGRPISSPQLPEQLNSGRSERVAKEDPEATLGHLHKRNLDIAGDISSLSALQASLPLPNETASPLSNDCPAKARLMLSDSHSTLSNTSPTSRAVKPNFATVVPSNDLEAFLNESDSDPETAPPSNCASPAEEKNRLKERPIFGRNLAESSDCSDDGDEQERFVSYSISKKKRSERRRQLKEDLRQLHVALENDPFTTSTSAVAATGLPFEAPNVVDALRKAQEEAMRMLSTYPALAIPPAGHVSSKKHHPHKHKHKKEHKNKDDEDCNKKSTRRSSRKHGSSLRSRSAFEM
uniref:GTP-binding protein Parf n=1 Tax=Peronospora matthiolae TaxID=2874970 RepID=A0AAV1TNR5_9STRA